MKKSLILALGILIANAARVSAADAVANYQQHCAKCHGQDGKGKTRTGIRLGARDYTDSKVQASVKDAEFVKAIKEGLKDKKTGKQVMKATSGLTDQEMKELVAYMRKFAVKISHQKT